MDDGTDTNGSSQNSLNAIAVLELCADVLPTEAPAGRGWARRNQSSASRVAARDDRSRSKSIFPL
jgi:hypothetical protein